MIYRIHQRGAPSEARHHDDSDRVTSEQGASKCHKGRGECWRRGVSARSSGAGIDRRIEQGHA
ncbi:hypothetical protein J5I95_13795 [Candidatus Poribacteria bacterium]|nr:hypothetical protein [Candidatus Poribacteria bacterium]